MTEDDGSGCVISKELSIGSSASCEFSECEPIELPSSWSSSSSSSIERSLSEGPSDASVSCASLLRRCASSLLFDIGPGVRFSFGTIVPRKLWCPEDRLVVDLVGAEAEAVAKLRISDTACCLDKELDVMPARIYKLQ